MPTNVSYAVGYEFREAIQELSKREAYFDVRSSQTL